MEITKIASDNRALAAIVAAAVGPYVPPPLSVVVTYKNRPVYSWPLTKSGDLFKAADHCTTHDFRMIVEDGGKLVYRFREFERVDLQSPERKAKAVVLIFEDIRAALKAAKAKRASR